MAECGGCGNCGGGCSKDSGWVPVKYYIMYEVRGYVGMGNWETVRKVELLENVADEKQAKKEAKKWLRMMKSMVRPNWDKLLSAKLVASIHKDILKLI